MTEKIYKNEDYGDLTEEQFHHGNEVLTLMNARFDTQEDRTTAVHILAQLVRCAQQETIKELVFGSGDDDERTQVTH